MDIDTEGNLDDDINEFSQTEGEKRKVLVNPWKNVLEFLEVYNWIFSDAVNKESKGFALQQIAIWQQRRGTLTPAAILATKVMLDVQLKDDSSNFYLEEDLQALYAMSLIRFFNYMSSIMQSHNIRTMYTIATELNLETFVVDYRHMCAHGQELPSLRVLRLAIKYCMDWLHNYYWIVQKSAMQDASNVLENIKKNEFVELFKVYDLSLECYLNEATSLKNVRTYLRGRSSEPIRKIYEKNALSDIKDLFDIIVRQLHALVKQKKTERGLKNEFIKAMFEMDFFFSLNESIVMEKENLELLIATTQGLFRIVAKYNFIESLFSKCLQGAENSFENQNRRASFGFWAKHISAGLLAFNKCLRKAARMNSMISDKRKIPIHKINYGQLNEKIMPNQLREVLLYSGIDLKRTLIFGHKTEVWTFDAKYLKRHLDHLNVYTIDVLKNLLPLIEGPVLTDCEMKLLSSILDDWNAGNEPFSIVNEGSLKLSDDEDSLLDESIAVNTLNNLGTKYDWTKCPLAKLPWDID